MGKTIALAILLTVGLLLGCQSLLEPQRPAPELAEPVPQVESPTIVEPVETSIETAEDAPKPFRPDMTVHFIDVGQGDATLLQTPSRKNVLVDCGPEDSGALLKYLKAIRLTKIDVLIVTHPHRETVGGCADVMKAYPPGAVYDNRVEPGNEMYDSYEYLARKAGQTRLHEGRRLLIDERLLSYALTAYDKETSMTLEDDESIVLSLRYGDMGFLLMGHCREGCEERLLETVPEKKDLDVDVLKVSLHGSAEASTLGFLDAVSPRVAVISVGKNRFGYPEEGALVRLDMSGADTYRTDQQGTIVMRTDGEHLVIETAKEQETAALDAEACPFAAARSSTKFYAATCQKARAIPPDERLCFATRTQALETGRQIGEC